MTKPKSELFDHINKAIKGQLVFDIGANQGQMTRRYIEAGGKVVAVEPQSELTSHRNFNGVFSIKHMCVADKPGKIDFYECVGHSVSSSCLKKWRNHYPEKEWRKITVPCVTLDMLIKEFGIPKFIKLDVEGYEDKVLDGLSQKIDLISFEFTKGFIDSSIRCVEILDKLKFKKIMPCIKRKLKRRSEGKKIRLYEIFEEFYNKEEAIKYLRKVSKMPNKKFQGDMLVIS